MIREFNVSDIPQLRELIRRQPFSYPEPDWSKMGGMVYDGRMFILDRMTSELYMAIDPDWQASPGEKIAAFAQLHEAERQSLEARGFTDAHIWLPPHRRSFAQRLVRDFGWVTSSGPENWAGLTRGV